MTTWQEVERNWTRFKPKFRAQWPRLTELDRIDGHRVFLARSLESEYELTHREAEREIDAFLKTLDPVR
ncbi:MAG TPA: CsbD family protein [Planctomycetota bacterium]|nr:CsbD family protein [Planctomycetota bacterium]